MRKPIPKTCLHCQQPFEARRRNQLYCSPECQTDANNALAKERYAEFKRKEPQFEALQLKVSQLEQDQQVQATSQVEELQEQIGKLQQQVGQLRQELAELTVVIRVDKPLEDTITYGGRRYKKEGKVSQPGIGVSVEKGGSLLFPGNRILYRPVSQCYEYVLDK